MENPCVEQFISSLAHSLEPGYPEFISRLNFSECRKEIDSLLKDRYDAQTASKDPLLCLLLNFHRQTSLACQSKAALEKEIDFLRAQNACLLHEVQTANKKAMRYLEDLHSAELDLCSHKEEVLRLRSERPAPPQSFSQCDSGYSDSHSSHNERLTPSPLRRLEQFPTDPKFLGMKSASQPPLRDRANSYLTSHLSETDTEETCSLSSRRYSAQCFSQPLIHDTVIRAHPSEGGTRTFQNCSASPLHYKESDNSCSAPALQPERTVVRDAHVHGSASLVLSSPEMTSQCPRLKVLELIAKDIDHFDTDSCNHHIEDYFRELEYNLVDLPHATQSEKVKLVWKTSSKAVHKFIQSQPSRVRNDYQELRQALVEEFSFPADETTSMVAALQIKHSRREHPRDYYQRLRHAYFQGKNAPGLEENPIFKSLFLQNLHPCVRTHVVLMTHQGNPSLHEIRKMTQVAWETVVKPKAGGKTTEPASSNTEVSYRSAASKDHPHNSPKGGDKKQHRNTERNRRVHQLRRDRHSHNRSFRRPYAEILAQKCDQTMDRSDDDHSISDHSSLHGHHSSDSDSASECLSPSGYTERYSPEPQVKNLRYKSSRARFSQF